MLRFATGPPPASAVQRLRGLDALAASTLAPHARGGGERLTWRGVGAALREVPLALWRRYLAYQLVHAHPPYFASALSGGALRETDSLSQASCTVVSEMGHEKVADYDRRAGVSGTRAPRLWTVRATVYSNPRPGGARSIRRRV